MTRPQPAPIMATESGLRTLGEVAEQLRRPEATLRYWRYLGTGPRSFKMRGRVFYRQSDVDSWLAHEEQNAIGQDVS